MKLPRTVTLVVLLAGCSARGGAPAVKSPPTAPGRPLLVSLQRDSCFGWCPAYRVDIDVDGTVRYEGRGAVCKDEASDRLPSAKLQALRAAIARSNFASTPEHCCDCPVSDVSAATITVADPPPAKTIVDAGDSCPGAPLSISKLADDIDAIVDIERWIGTDDERQNCWF